MCLHPSFLFLPTYFPFFRSPHVLHFSQSIIRAHLTLSTVCYIYGMDFFTKINIPEADFNIDYASHLTFFGSCFADNISALFAARKFHVLSNPFGTVYNPVSLASQIKTIADSKTFDKSDIFQDTRCDGLWHCWNAHSSLSAPTQEACIAKLNDVVKSVHEYLQKSNVILITLGTAFVYTLKQTGNVVSNCHRQDPNLFTRRILSVEETTQALESIINDIFAIKNQNNLAKPFLSRPQIIFTVSPLRHLSDGAHANTLSKATLQLAINIIQQKSKGAISYFPSYEIVMDELRDYRFYENDMVHLSKTAEEYIFERIIGAYCSKDTRNQIDSVEKFMKGVNHRIAAPQSTTSKTFTEKAIAQAMNLESQIPGLDLSEEIKYFKSF